MTRHIFKLVWNRKRSTGLIMVEILICFLVLCGVLSSAVNLLQHWRQPLGFEWENVWHVRIGGPSFFHATDEEIAQSLRGMREALAEAKRIDAVEVAAVAANVPYDGSSWMNSVWIDGRQDHVLQGPVTPEYFDAMGFEMVYGRWLDESDPALAHTSVVITRNLARDLFGNEDAVGKVMPEFGENGEIEEPEDDSDIQRVVGVVEDIKRRGELDPVPYMVFVPIDFHGDDYLPSRLVLRTRPGTGADFEEGFVRSLQQVVPGWSYSMRRMEDMRHDRLMGRVNPLIISGVVAAFLVIMVGLGLVGVLWQSVTRRTGELGVRRAMGASALSVRRQVLGELWALTTLSVTLGVALFLQLPIIGMDFGMGWPVFVVGAAMAALVIYGFVTICGLYPTWLATRVHPAEALQYE